MSYKREKRNLVIVAKAKNMKEQSKKGIILKSM